MVKGLALTAEVTGVSGKWLYKHNIKIDVGETESAEQWKFV